MSLTASSWISKKPDRQGGDACVRDTRIPVWVLADCRRWHMSDGEILQAYPSLTPSDLTAAWDYVADHQEEIEITIRENEEGEADLVD